MSTPAPDSAPIPNYHGPQRGAPAAPLAPPALTPEQLRAIQLGELSWKKLKRADLAARIDGGLTAFFGVCCLLLGCGGWENLVLAACFGGIAFNSFRLAARLRKADITAPASLAMNQVYLAAIVILYALYAFYQMYTGKSEILAQLGDLSSVGIDAKGIGRLLAWAIYGGLILGTILAQGGAAIYYFTRKKYLQAYIEQTPPWVVDMLRTRL